MSNNWLAFFIGLFGSLHCVGMCGPLALAVPSSGAAWWLVVWDKFLYNAGRVVTYAFLGLLVGIIGKQLWFYGLQQGISLVSGLLIVFAGLSGIFRFRLAGNRLFSSLLLPVNRLLGYALQHHAGNFAIGLLNGLLPCGFVYLALAGAINNSSPGAAAQYMFCFGLGTFPLMLLATIGAGFMGPPLRRRITRTLPYLMVLLGLWFILRGMSLNIPYLSPAAQSLNGTCK